MIEIFALLALTGVIGRLVEAKGYQPRRYRLMTILLWFVGEFIGFFVGAYLGTSQICLYAFALVGAASGALFSYLIARRIPTLQPSQTPPAPQ